MQSRDMLWHLQYLMLFLVVLMASFRTAQSAPGQLSYYRSVSPAEQELLYRTLFEGQNRVAPSKRDKKYDRNCFFSPVQCMLSYNTNNNDALYHPHGRK